MTQRSRSLKHATVSIWLRQVMRAIEMTVSTPPRALAPTATGTRWWDGAQLTLTPAYDLCPQLRSGETASHALNLTRTPDERASQLRLCRKTAPDFLLSGRDADLIIEAQLEVISREWDEAADEAQLTKAERNYLWRRQILNPYIHYDQA